MNYKMEEVYQLLHLPKGKNYIFLLLRFWDTYKIDVLRTNEKWLPLTVNTSVDALFISDSQQYGFYSTTTNHSSCPTSNPTHSRY